MTTHTYTPPPSNPSSKPPGAGSVASTSGPLNGAMKGPPLFHLPCWVQALLGMDAFCWTLEFCSHSTSERSGPPPPHSFFVIVPFTNALCLQNKTTASEPRHPICPPLLPAPQRFRQTRDKAKAVCALSSPPTVRANSDCRLFSW